MGPTNSSVGKGDLSESTLAAKSHVADQKRWSCTLSAKQSYLPTKQTLHSTIVWIFWGASDRQVIQAKTDTPLLRITLRIEPFPPMTMSVGAFSEEEHAQALWSANLHQIESTET